MLTAKKYIFHYDTSKAAWCGHTKYLNHDSKECVAFICDDEPLGVLDLVHVKFEDGFTANVYTYELEEIS